MSNDYNPKTKEEFDAYTAAMDKTDLAMCGVGHPVTFEEAYEIAKILKHHIDFCSELTTGYIFFSEEERNSFGGGEGPVAILKKDGRAFNDTYFRDKFGGEFVKEYDLTPKDDPRKSAYQKALDIAVNIQPNINHCAEYVSAYVFDNENDRVSDPIVVVKDSYEVISYKAFGSKKYEKGIITEYEI